MNSARVASLLRELADAIEEDGAEERESKPAKKTVRRARAREYPMPTAIPSETDMMRARAMLRRRGIG